MFLNIITPCSRPENLLSIEKSINIPREYYRWIIVFDLEEFPDASLIPDSCEKYLLKDKESIVGNAQRNFALDLVEKGHIYINDDDTEIHPNLWNSIKDFNDDFISFAQAAVNGEIRLLGNTIQVGNIDSHNFIISVRAMGDIRWILNRYEADGIFAENVFRRVSSQDNMTVRYIPEVLSIYNSLRL